MIRFAIASLAVLLAGQVSAADINRAYLDDQQNVHVVSSSGKDRRITSSGRSVNVQLSADHQTVAWLVRRVGEGEEGQGSSELVVYRGQHMRSIRCEPFIRDYWFWMQGRRIAIDCGGMHFAGVERLYDVRTLAMVASFSQRTTPTAQRPAWSSSSDHYVEDGH